MAFRVVAAVLAGLLMMGAGYARAAAGDWVVRVGGSMVDPKSDNHAIVEVEPDTMVTFNVSYFFTDRWALELLAALPFEHDIDLVGGGRVASTKHLPPTISGQYHFRPSARVRPYVGVGLNVTEFFEEDTTGALAGADLELDRSVGVAAQIGLDVDLTDNVFFNIDVRYIDIETDAKLNGARLGTVEIDPWLVGLNLGFKL